MGCSLKSPHARSIKPSCQPTRRFCDLFFKDSFFKASPERVRLRTKAMQPNTRRMEYLCHCTQNLPSLFPKRSHPERTLQSKAHQQGSLKSCTRVLETQRKYKKPFGPLTCLAVGSVVCPRVPLASLALSSSWSPFLVPVL